MILYTLCCDNGHTFDAWFRDSAAYDQQAEAGVITCPLCGSARVTKAIMAPSIPRHHGARRDGPGPVAERRPREDGPAPDKAADDDGSGAPACPDNAGAGSASGVASGASPGKSPADAAARLMEALESLRTQVEATCDDVGDNFAEEARRIHYGETEVRGIYGDTTPEEAEALREEGVAFSTIPWRRRRVDG